MQGILEMNKSAYLIVTIMLLLASCIPAAEVSTPVDTSILSFTSTLTPHPTSIPNPSKVSNPSPTLLFTPNATEIAMGFVQSNCFTMGLDAKMSPDSIWLASSCIDESDAHVRIARFDGEKGWDLFFQDITDFPPCLVYKNQYGEDACFYGILHIDHWHKNGRYVFVDADFLVDRATSFSFGLYRIDAETGQISPYLPMNGFTYVYAFSSDDEKYAYASGNDNYLLHIVSIETGQDISFTVPGKYASIGELLWSPTNEDLILVTHGIGWEDNPAVGFSLVILDIKSGEFTTLISNDVRRLRPKKWLSDDTVLLDGFSDDGQAYLEYQFTVSNNQLAAIPSATPRP